ncbi:MAG: hypothetical protein CVU38_03060 [Chloroflexi bacterium HGW-Chloroflexi-1]|nr:MAG: hypothetical protein CVU38_03060 [Chloroflexi bacterium HGW-Chloroflexi-1]
MSTLTHRRQIAIGMLFIMLLGVVAGCAPAAPQVPAATVPPQVVEVIKEVPVTVAPQVVEVIKEVPVTVAPPVAKKEVKILRVGYQTAEMPLDMCVTIYNDLPERAKDNVKIVLDPAGKGPGDPLLGQMRKDGKMIWNGTTALSPFTAMVTAVGLEDIVPIEPYIQASQYVTAAQRIQEQLFPVSRGENTYQGKLYALPVSMNVVVFMYRKDYLAAVGYPEPPKTWDEVLDAAKKVQEKFKDQKVFGFAPTPAVAWRYMSALHQAFSPSDKLFTPEGLWNITDPGWIAAMETTKKFIDADVVPKGWETWPYPEIWKTGKVAMAVSQVSMASWGALIWGYENLGIMLTPPGPGMEKEKVGTNMWSTSVVLYNGAPYPQETMDFFVWLLDPDNETWQRGVFKSGKMSPYVSAYDKYINPDDVTQSWALGVRTLLGAASPTPSTKWPSVYNGFIVPHFVNFLLGKETAEAGMAAAQAEMAAEMKK